MSDTDAALVGFECLWSAFDQLSNADLYASMKLRVDIFVVEQNCPYPELDDRDGTALHLLVKESGELVGYLRLLPPHGDKPVVLGRIAVAETFRSRRIGGGLLNAGLGKSHQLFPGRKVYLSAQAHLQKFYQRHGFVRTSDEYLEDGIPHIDMLHDNRH
ncbi:MAG: GNAT family N-acetyltransferase [Stappiaceae bacterium]